MANKLHKALLHTLLGSASLLVLPVAAHAQATDTDATAPAAEAPATAAPATPADAGADKAAGEIVVTGSRITQNGYQAPTPVTVAAASELLKSSPTSLADGLNKLPQLVGSFGPNKTSNVFARPEHGNILNLRGIGPTRTLILLDGLRAPPTTFNNTVDVDLFPTLLVQRVDVVTAGASSVYGSDAVTGIVNFVLDTKFTGVKGMIQGGMTSRNDNHNSRAGLAFGSDLGERLHVIASVDFNINDGYLNIDRPVIGTPGSGVGSLTTGTPGTAANPFIQVANTRANFATYGGLAVSGPFANTNFISPGVFAPVNRGTPTGTTSFFVAPSDYIYQGQFLSASAPTRNMTGFGRLNYDLGNDAEIYVQGIFGDTKIKYQGYPNLFLTTTVVPIFSGNPYIPAALQQQLTNTGTASFNVAKLFTELGPIKTRERAKNYDFATGIKGNIGTFKVTLDYQYGRSVYDFAQRNQFDLAKFNAASDAVRDPATGNIVCRPTLSTDAAVRARYAGCVPINILGYGAATSAAAAYVQGTSIYHALNVVNDVAFNISGDVFDLPAGPVSISAGAEYRTAKLALTSNSDPGVPVDVTGLRGISANTVRFYLTNTAQAKGHQNVKEAFGEIVVPILKDSVLGERLDLNAAIRETDYSTSGSVRTWKIGGTWQPVDDIRFRAAKSRDIRAPTLFDLFAGPQFVQVAVLDPHTGISTGFNQITSGNAKLVPEIGNTFTAGTVIQPRFLPGFSLSVDYYKVKIAKAITTLPALAILQDCEASGGTAPSCANVSRPLPFSDRTAANIPTLITISGINASLIKTSGIDFDGTFRHKVGDGQGTIRLYATRLNTFKTQLTGTNPVIDYAGYNAAGSGGVTAGLPKWKGTLSVNYDIGPFSVFVQENYTSSIKFGPVQVYKDPHIPAFYTTDLTLTYRDKLWGSNIQFFASASNLFDKAVPAVYSTGNASLNGTLPGLYDSTGLSFVVGARFAF